MVNYPALMIRSFRGAIPKVAPSCYIDPSAQLIGDVTIGERSSVWPNATVRGDVHWIRIGEGTSIQDNSVLHVESGKHPLVVGNYVTVGHSAVLHGCTIEDDCIIGIGAIVLNGATVGKGSVIAAGALVSEGAQIPPGSLAMGVPAKVKREVSAEEQQRFRTNAEHYIELRQLYREEPS
jgi:carbonic anhydrase/acetyltransferase-like protein (isoleucine patch superfamily)